MDPKLAEAFQKVSNFSYSPDNVYDRRLLETSTEEDLDYFCSSWIILKKSHEHVLFYSVLSLRGWVAALHRFLLFVQAKD